MNKTTELLQEMQKELGYRESEIKCSMSDSLSFAVPEADNQLLHTCKLYIKMNKSKKELNKLAMIVTNFMAVMEIPLNAELAKAQEKEARYEARILKEENLAYCGSCGAVCK